MTAVKITPSPQAHRLYGDMAARADDGHLTLVDTLDLAIERQKRGYGRDLTEVSELQMQGWIVQAPDGGWHIR